MGFYLLLRHKEGVPSPLGALPAPSLGEGSVGKSDAAVGGSAPSLGWLEDSPTTTPGQLPASPAPAAVGPPCATLQSLTATVLPAAPHVLPEPREEKITVFSGDIFPIHT